MFRLIILVILLLLSLLNVYKAPTNALWYLSILVTEFCWVFIAIIIGLLFIKSSSTTYNALAYVVAISAILLFSVPLFTAYKISQKLDKQFDEAFLQVATEGRPEVPFSILGLVSGINATTLNFKTLTYNTGKTPALTLDFYNSSKPGNRPCVIVVHGGSWAGGDSRQLPELNSVLALDGYHVAAINYRLAPVNKYPAPKEDLQSTLAFLKTNAAKFSIDTTNIVLLGRSAGGQIVLDAAYTLKDPSIKGVISFYGPADMVWGYANPTSPLIMDSKKIMENYLGGTYKQVPHQYINSSAVESISKQAVPTLLIHGKNDPLVGYVHTEHLSEKLRLYGIKHYVLTLPWATHACDYTLNGPSGQLSTYTVLRFLEAVTR